MISEATGSKEANLSSMNSDVTEIRIDTMTSEALLISKSVDISQPGSTGKRLLINNIVKFEGGRRNVDLARILSCFCFHTLDNKLFRVNFSKNFRQNTIFYSKDL